MASVTSFSRVPPCPMAPGSSPPWPGIDGQMMADRRPRACSARPPQLPASTAAAARPERWRGCGCRLSGALPWTARCVNADEPPEAEHAPPAPLRARLESTTSSCCGRRTCQPMACRRHRSELDDHAQRAIARASEADAATTRGERQRACRRAGACAAGRSRHARVSEQEHFLCRAAPQAERTVRIGTRGQLDAAQLRGRRRHEPQPAEDRHPPKKNLSNHGLRMNLLHNLRASLREFKPRLLRKPCLARAEAPRPSMSCPLGGAANDTPDPAAAGSRRHARAIR